MMTQPFAVSIRGLKKTFKTDLGKKPTQALRGLSLDVPPGEILGFLGPNGAGKTTTIKILVGLLKPDEGQAGIFGFPVDHIGARTRLGYLPELPDFYDYLRPYEFLTHCAQVSGLNPTAIRKKVPELLERVGLDPNDRRQLRKYSKGMLQRVGICQTMLADPDLYILDEPMGGLDPLGRRWVKDWIQELGKTGKTVFFSSHVLAEAEAVCHRVALIHKGRLLTQGSMQEIRKIHAGGWEIVVEGNAILADTSIAAQSEKIEPAGTESLLSPKADTGPEGLLKLLLERGYIIRSVSQRQASLEEVFVRTLKADSQTS